MTRARRRRSSSAIWLALLGLLIQALLPAVHHPAGMAMAGGMGIGGGLNLCLAPGTKPPAEPGKTPAHHLPACPLCQAIHAIGGFAPPTAPSLPRWIGRAMVVPALAIDGNEPPLYRAHAQPRAPPLA